MVCKVKCTMPTFYSSDWIAQKQTASFLFVVSQVKRLPHGKSGVPERSVTLSIPLSNPPVMPQPEVHHEQLPHQPQSPSQSQLRQQAMHPQSQLYPQHEPHVGTSSRAGEPAVVHSHQGSPLHLSADSACSSSSLPGRGPMLKPPTMPQWGENVTLMSASIGIGRMAGLTSSPFPLR